MALELDQIGMNPQVLVTAGEVLDAVERVALEIRRYGAPLQRSYSTSQIRAEPLDLSLWGYLTSPETRKFCRQYYSDDLRPPTSATDRQKLNALRLATMQKTEFEPRTNPYTGESFSVYGPSEYAVDGRAWMAYASE
jgi:hypothetical protein